MLKKIGLIITLIFILCACFTLQVNADGGFVWNGYKRLREPDQKAIIVFDEGIEELFLKVKFEGKITEFGWIVPLPSKPKVKNVTFSCFHILDMEYNLGKKLYYTPMDIIKAIWASKGGDLGCESVVEIIDDREIGDYQIKVLKADDGKSIRSWLNKNKFKIPAGDDEVLNSYIKKNWYFVAITIKTGSQTAEKQAMLQRGELAPLHFTFKTDTPVYPLHISSLNQGTTHLKLYLYARELYGSKFLIPKERDFVSYRQAFLRFSKWFKGHIMIEEELAPIVDEPVGFYLNEQLPSSLRYEIDRPTRGQWYCSRFEKKIACSEMQDDIIFSSNEQLIKKIVVTKRKIEKKLGDIFAASSSRPSILLKASWPLVDLTEHKYDYYENCQTLEAFRAKVMPPFTLPAKLKSFVSEHEEKTLRLFLTQTETQLSYPHDYDSIQKWLLKPDNSLFAKGWFQIWQLRQAEPSLSGVDHCFFTQATPFFRRFLLPSVNYYTEQDDEYSYNGPWDNNRQYQALKLLLNYRDPRSFDFLANWLKHKNPNVRKSALAVMLNSLFNCVAGTAWAGGIRAYICKSAFDNRKLNCDKVRPLLKDSDADCRQAAAWILALLGDGQSKSFFLKTAIAASKVIHRKVIFEPTKELITVKSQIALQELAKASLIAMANFKDKEYKALIIKLLKGNSPQNTLINSKYLLIAAAAYIADPKIKQLLFKKQNLIKLVPIAEVIREPLIRWMDAEIAQTNDPELKLAKIIYSSKDGKYDLKEIKKKLKVILNQTNLTIDMLARLDQLQYTYCRFYINGYGYSDWVENSKSIMYDNLDTLIPIFWKHKKALLNFTPGALWAWRRLSFGRLDKLSPQKRLSIIETVLTFQDQALKSGRITRTVLIEKCNRYNLLRWAVLAKIQNRQRIKKYMNQFKSNDPNYRACEMMLGENSLCPKNHYDVKNDKNYHDLLVKNRAVLKLWTKLYGLRCFGEGRKNILLKQLDEPEALAIVLDEFNDNSYSAVYLCQNAENLKILKQKSREFNKNSPVWLEEYMAIMFRRYYKFFDRLKEILRDNPGNLRNADLFFEIIKHDSELLEEIKKEVDDQIKYPNGEKNLIKMKKLRQKVVTQLKKR